MKNKILSILVVLFVLSTCVFTLTACEDKDKCVNKNGHAYGQWVSNGDGTHTRVCAYDMSHQETLNCGGGTATCTQKAVCAICLQLYGEPKGHSIVIDQGVASTCTETGLTEGSHCKTCGEVLVEQNNVDIVPHNYNKSICSYCGISNLAFELNASGTAYTVEGVGSCDETEIIIPATFSGKPVTSINSFAFENCDSLTSVVIPNGVTSIGDKAFYGCSSLTEIVIPNSVTKIGYSVFENCSSLINVEIPNKVTDIASYAFAGCGALTSVVIPNGVTSIGYGAFVDCDSLTSVVIGDSVNFIGASAFFNCSSLISVNYTGTIDQWVQIEFKSSTSNPLYYANELKINNVIVKDVVLATTTKISDYAFYGCNSIKSVVIGDSVRYMGVFAFYNCFSLTSVKMGSGLTSISDSVFGNCSKLISIEIGDSVTYIDWYAFYGCSSLTSVCIPNSVTSIGFLAFANCISLTSVVIGNGVTYIDNGAFALCERLTSIVIPNSVTYIGNVIFPESLTSIKYRGTKVQWGKISKGDQWDYYLDRYSDVAYKLNYTITYNYTGE